MPTVKFPSMMKFYVGNQSEFQVDGGTVSALLENVLMRHPALKPHLFDSKGNLHRHFNIFVNGQHIRDLDGLETNLASDDNVILLASAAGG